MTLNQGLITSKLDLIEQYQRQLTALLELSDAEIISLPAQMAAVERFFQLMVDSMVDINQHIIRELDLKSADDLQSTFYPLGKKDILPNDFAQKLAPIVGVRNRLVHQYEDLDKKLFLKNLRDNFSQFETYREFIIKYLSAS